VYGVGRCVGRRCSVCALGGRGHGVRYVHNGDCRIGDGGDGDMSVREQTETTTALNTDLNLRYAPPTCASANSIFFGSTISVTW
jgi:hypothetical protein